MSRPPPARGLRAQRRLQNRGDRAPGELQQQAPGGTHTPPVMRLTGVDLLVRLLEEPGVAENQHITWLMIDPSAGTARCGTGGDLTVEDCGVLQDYYICTLLHPHLLRLGAGGGAAADDADRTRSSNSCTDTRRSPTSGWCSRCRTWPCGGWACDASRAPRGRPSTGSWASPGD
jgi:hypothetical protein